MLRDFLPDMKHYCDTNEEDFYVLLSQAEEVYGQEIDEEESEFK